MSHTPGPWKLYSTHPPEQYVELIFSDDDNNNYRVFKIKPGKTISPNQAKANAQLIAAAPELLKALKEILECFITAVGLNENDLDTDGFDYAAVKNARVAILKATKEK